MSTTPRAIHLVDVENIFALTWGKPVSCLAGELYRTIASVGDGDLIEVAADITRVFDTKAAFPGAQLRHGRGHDGADRALIENFDIDHAAKRFDAVVIGSGDHAFIDVAYRARQRGLKVVVVSRPSSRSRALASYADLVIDVPEFEFAAYTNFCTSAHFVRLRAFPSSATSLVCERKDLHVFSYCHRCHRFHASR